MEARPAKAAARAVGDDGCRVDLRGRFIDVGLHVFSRRSYTGSRITDLTDAVGVAKATFYLYFRDKRELLLACLEHVHALVAERETRIEPSEEDPLARLTARLLIGLKEHSFWDILPGFLLKISTSNDDAEIVRAAWQAWSAVIEPSKRDLQKAIDQGAAREVEVELAVSALTGMVNTLSQRAEYDDTYDAGSLVALGKDVIRRVLQPSPTLDPDAPSAAEGMRAILVDCSGVRVDLGHPMFDRKSRILGSLGRGRVIVEPALVSQMVIGERGEECRFELSLIDGTTASLMVQGGMEISGESSFGAVSFVMRDVETLTFLP